MPKKPQFLSPDVFEIVLSSTPLVSVDLVLENSDQQFLLGFRNYRPAKGYWFVPGGRILKNEPIFDAITRILAQEVDSDYDREKITLLGVFDHIYPDSILPDESGIGTHYVALAFHIVTENTSNIPISDSQHSELRWFDAKSVLNNDAVHPHSQNYVAALLGS